MSLRLKALTLIALLASAACTDDRPVVSPKDHAEGLYIKGTAEYLQGQFQAALASFDAMAKLAPNDPRLPAARGEVYLSLGKFTDASNEFETAVKLDPKRSTNWSRLGMSQAQLGRNQEAISSLRKAVALYPNDYSALEQIGDIHLKKKEHDEAIQHFVLAANAASGETKSELLMRAVNVLMVLNREADAMTMLEKAAREGLRTPAILTALGDGLVKGGKLVEAAATYQEAASKSPRDPTLWELVGTIHMRLDKPGDAIAAYKESLRVKDRAVVHVALARIQLGLKSQEGAAQELVAAFECEDVKEVSTQRELASLLIDMNRKKDALLILGNLSAEPELDKDVELQLATARLANELKDTALRDAACARAIVADKTPKKCP
ncbi:tetratricopeptide repeat protein [Myxococcus sp. K15C18031901]|uniref:tetratricopeptide repeat protein n=1 Tax=Myxococcus dinghuensis TaxID=2906761 RepID=UPI0020A76441|nr:tetratricopeptide repeat protein [Myxococcus dinghuensis]MCP3105151.1 tetratricopeptide repeat protein [Myxococcus dinghuensis]